LTADQRAFNIFSISFCEVICNQRHQAAATDTGRYISEPYQQKGVYKMFRFMPKSQLTLLICCTCLTLLFYGSDIYAEENLPPIPSGSDFLDQIDSEVYSSLSSPEKAPLLRWDFSGNKVYPFDFSQKIIMKNEMDDMFGNETRQASTQSMEGYGKLSLKSEGNNVARFVLEDPNAI
jgi:hypothetical protein